MPRIYFTTTKEFFRLLVPCIVVGVVTTLRIYLERFVLPTIYLNKRHSEELLLLLQVPRIMIKRFEILEEGNATQTKQWGRNPAYVCAIFIVLSVKS